MVRYDGEPGATIARHHCNNMELSQQFKFILDAYLDVTLDITLQYVMYQYLLSSCVYENYVYGVLANSYETGNILNYS